jgi:type II secretory pathway component GspD/PulD (secretin)
MNGIGITKIDDQFFKAVPASGMNVHVPIWLDGPALAIKPSQRIYVKMFHLEYAPALEVREQLNPFSTPNVGTLIVFEKANSILATDSLLNLQRMEQLLQAIDRPISKDELGTEFFIWETQHAGAKELEGKVKGMVEGSLKPFLGGTTQIDSDERTGKLIVVTRRENLETIKFILETLDSPIKIKASSKHFKLQHAEAKDVKAILDEVIKNQKAVKDKVQKTNNSRPVSGLPAKNAPVPSTSSSSETTSEGDGAHEFSDLVTIAADERGNAILGYGTENDLDEIERMIDSLDDPLPMARLDTIFVMVDVQDQSQRGIDSLFNNLQYSKATERYVTDPGEDPLSPADDRQVLLGKDPAGDGFSGDLRIPGLNSGLSFQLNDWKLTGVGWGQIFAQASSRNDVRIFSSPSLMVSHNSEKVHIMIEDERPYVRPYYYGDYNRGSSVQQNSQMQPGSDRDMLSAKTSLEISKPKIGLPIYLKDKKDSFIKDENGNKILSKRGSIFMEVEVKAEKFDETNVNVYEGQELPAKKNREAKTFLTVNDGEIIVLGGLQEVQFDQTTSKYNFLSSIPYVGEKFFTPKSSKYTPTELLIFIKPTIIDPFSDKETFLDRSEDNSNLIDERLQADFIPKFRSPSGEILNPSGKNLQKSAQDIQSSKPTLF